MNLGKFNESCNYRYKAADEPHAYNPVANEYLHPVDNPVYKLCSSFLKNILCI